MKLFVSSTFRDLRPERDATIATLQRSKFLAIGMEYFASEPDSPRAVALRNLADSDVMILLIGFRAGSMIPSDTITYTGAEFEQARHRGIPIFVFIKTRAGNWENDETDGSLRAALFELKASATGHLRTPAYFETAADLEREALTALIQWTERGRPGARKTFTTGTEYFSPSPVPRPLIDFAESLHGRTNEMQILRDFVATSAKTVALVPGRGGIGKTKLLKHWCETVTGFEVVWLNDAAIWHPESDKEIPVGPVVLVADDAHHIEELEKLLVLVRARRETFPTKLVLTTRPSGIDQINAKLTPRFEQDEILRITPLEQLSAKEVRELAEEVLGPRFQRFVPSLAALSYDTPLVTIVGGRLIARGELSPDLLGNAEEFRHAVLDRYVTEYQQALPDASFPWIALLQLLAAVQPVSPNDANFKEAAAAFLARRPDEIVSAVDTLKSHGLVQWRGSLARIVPDVLADYILERRCVTNTGASTGYAHAVFERFRDHYLSNLLRNLSELDWRMAQQAPAADLMQEIWNTFTTEFTNGQAYTRLKLCEALTEAAAFQPRQTRALIRIALDDPARPFEVAPFRFGRWDQDDDVIASLPALMEGVAYHSEHTAEMMQLLLDLANRRKKGSDHALRIIKEFAKYGRYKNLGWNDYMAEIAKSLVADVRNLQVEQTPLRLIAPLLAHAGEFTESDGLTITLGSFTLNYDVIRPIREKAIEVLFTVFDAGEVRGVIAALKVLSKVLHGSLRPVAGGWSDEERVWQEQERLTVLDMVDRRLAGTLPIAVRRQVLHLLHSIGSYPPSDAVEGRIKEVLARYPVQDELEIFDAFCTPYWDRDRGEDFHRAMEKSTDRARRAGQRLRELHPKNDDAIAALSNMAQAASDYGIDVSESADLFASEICADAEFADALTRHTLDTSESLVLLSGALRRLRENHTLYGEFMRQGADHPDARVGRSAANALVAGVRSAPDAADIPLRERFLRHTDLWVQRQAFLAIHALLNQPAFVNVALELLLHADVGEEDQIGDALCECFSARNFDPSMLSPEQVDAVLEKLIPIPELRGHYTQRVLSWVGEHRPLSVVRFFLSRLSLDATIERRQSGASYKPVPYSNLEAYLRGIAKTPEYPFILEQLRGNVLSDTLSHHWSKQLFCAVATFDTATFSCMDEWLHSGDVEKIKESIGLLCEIGPQLALQHPAFVAHVLECCQSVSTDLVDRAIGSFITNALYQGIEGSTIGQPPEKAVSIREGSDELLTRFPDGPMHALFTKMRKSAENRINSNFREDQDFLAQ
jgi:hypothetical protein